MCKCTHAFLVPVLEVLSQVPLQCLFGGIVHYYLLIGYYFSRPFFQLKVAACHVHTFIHWKGQWWWLVYLFGSILVVCLDVIRHASFFLSPGFAGELSVSGVSMPAAGDWVPQVETLTHAPPTRRLWMGPQFSFKTVSFVDKFDDSGKSRDGDEEEGQDFVGAVLPASQDLLDFLEFSQPHLQPLPSPRSGESGNGTGSLPSSLDGGRASSC